MRILVTGATGFVGRHFLALGGDEVIGVARCLPKPPWPAPCPLYRLDLLDTPGVVSLLRQIEPDAIVHLAGYADAGGSFRDPEAAWSGNLSATLSLYRAVETWGGRPRILFISSGAVYGAALAHNEVCNESTPLLPNSPYGASKAAADLASYQAYCHPGLPIIRVRPFNQIGPGQSNRYSVAAFAEQIARIDAGLAPPVLETGNLHGTRDLTDVRDMVRAYRLLLDRGEPGNVYNAGRGSAVVMRDVVDQLIRLSGRAVEVRVTSERVRPQEANPAVIAVDRLQAQTGWSPVIPPRQSLQDVLDDWRARVRSA
jgi:GDP-4-dehydro-6-deoxy-D-mannose reductase